MGDLILEMSDNSDIELLEESGSDIDLMNGLPYYKQGTDDYDELKNKPSINHVTLIGNLQLADLFQDGIIINGGDSTGYTPPVVPTGVPDAEGVMF